MTDQHSMYLRELKLGAHCSKYSTSQKSLQLCTIIHIYTHTYAHIHTQCVLLKLSVHHAWESTCNILGHILQIECQTILCECRNLWLSCKDFWDVLYVCCVCTFISIVHVHISVLIPWRKFWKTFLSPGMYTIIIYVCTLIYLCTVYIYMYSVVYAQCMYMCMH